MKKAFTLVELMVVVVVIAILASIVFRIAGLGESNKARNLTVARLQKLENAISGYFAAYGSYPPVALQGRSRNIFYEVKNGIQQVTKDPDAAEIDWNRVEAACRAQPVACEFPFKAGMHAYVKMVSDTLVQSGKDDMVFDALDNPEQLSKEKKDAADWTYTQVFKFGLISYLLPRYLTMMGYGAAEQNTAAGASLYDGFAQWGDNNSMPCRFEDGVQYENWSDLNNDLGKDEEKWKVALLPSQAVCARWIANLEGMLSCFNPEVGTVYGVKISDGGGGLAVGNPPSQIYSSGDSQSGSDGRTQPYILDKISCNDGWGNEFYYYSPPPYQGYRLWSAGPNGKTFPPWFPDREIEDLKDKNMIRNWLSDDIVHMRN